MAYTSHDAVKVVLINTQYVETDTTSFKSVVQSLTGKDSCVEWIEKSSYAAGKRKRPVAVNGGIERSGHFGNGGCGSSSAVPMLSKGMSFKELDSLMSEVPPMEEFHWLWAQ
ncbi:VQ motif-containing protein 1-like [Quercus robur]|uniref:VQ domain-containing protein n=1 Tax=Quercus lobata TaxID=97700 RepID=A0A7N2LRF6_QUELO|nr:VQ motif-containing protein 1-like [Quercus lobata]XP_050290225.1 VQ motif-containing protein 1-like [Quercus robur]